MVLVAPTPVSQPHAWVSSGIGELHAVLFFLHWREADHMQTFYRWGENNPSWNVSCGGQLDDVTLPAQLLSDSEPAVIKCSVYWLGEGAWDGRVQDALEHSWSWLLSGEPWINSTLRTRVSAEWMLSSYLCDEPKAVGSRASCWDMWQADTCGLCQLRNITHTGFSSERYGEESVKNCLKSTQPWA